MEPVVGLDYFDIVHRLSPAGSGQLDSKQLSTLRMYTPAFQTNVQSRCYSAKVCRYSGTVRPWT